MKDIYGNDTPTCHGVVSEIVGIYANPIYELIEGKDSLTEDDMEKFHRLFTKLLSRFKLEIEQKEILIERLINHSETDPILNT